MKDGSFKVQNPETPKVELPCHACLQCPHSQPNAGFKLQPPLKYLVALNNSSAKEKNSTRPARHSRNVLRVSNSPKKLSVLRSVRGTGLRAAWERSQNTRRHQTPSESSSRPKCTACIRDSGVRSFYNDRWTSNIYLSSSISHFSWNLAGSGAKVLYYAITPSSRACSNLPAKRLRLRMRFHNLSQLEAYSRLLCRCQSLSGLARHIKMNCELNLKNSREVELQHGI